MDRDLKSSFASASLLPDEETSYNSSDFSMATNSTPLFHLSSSPPPSFSFFAQHFTSNSQTFKIPKKETSLPLPDPLFTNLNPHTNNPQTSNSIVEGFSILSSNPSQKNKRQRCRQTMGDKFRILQKLMPWDKRMDTATMLAEAYNYINFLQAQVKALQAMPLFDDPTSTHHSFNTDNYVCALGSVFGAMGMLTRQQLLQVLLNTPEALTRLYSQRCCLFSIEQLLALNKVAALEQQLMMFGSTN
ncbi:transcription factor bHLH117 [Ricinus communis]|uniref:transcription factor bHLH117 n=1 Tax=Ricinus communis TaxID=3988 RepID=UPI00201A817F|nr:transcription factor bHLH117 [Ricinus communis]